MRALNSEYRRQPISRHTVSPAIAMAAMAVLAVSVSPLSAAPNTTATWTGAGADTNWGTAGNWTPDVPGVIDGAADTSLAIFTGTPGVLAPNLDANYNVGSVMFGATAVSGAFTLGTANGSSLIFTGTAANPTAPTATAANGNQLINNAGAPAAAGAQFQTISAPITLANTSGTATGSGLFFFAANGGSTTTGVTSTSLLKLTGTVTGSASTGLTSTLTLYGGNNVRNLGGNEISGVIGNGANGGTLALAFRQGNQFGTNGSTLWILSGANTYSGGTLINTNGFSGTLQARNNAAFGTGAITWSASGGNFNTLNFGVAGLNLANDMIVTGSTAQIDTVLNGATLSGVISSPTTAGNLRKNGNNTLTLTGANTYTGNTQINGGLLAVSTINSVAGGTASSNLGAPTTVANGTIALNNGGLSYIGSTGETTDRVVNLAGTTGGGTIDQSGTGLLKFTSALTATGAGSKTLTLSGSTAGTGEVANTIVDNASGTFLTNVTKSGTGTWTLSGNNSYTGQTSITNGTLLLGNANGLGSGTATINLTTTSGSTAATVTASTGLTVGSQVTGTGIQANTFVTAISGTSVTLSRAATASNAALPTSFTGTTTVASGGTLDLAGLTTGEILYTINGTGVGGNGALINTSATAASIAQIGGQASGNPGSFAVGGPNDLGDIALGNVIGGTTAFTLTKNGVRTLTLGGTLDNAFLTVTQNSGTVVINKNASTNNAGANNFNLNGGTLQFGPLALTSVNRQVNNLFINGTAGTSTLDLNGAVGNGGTLVRLTGAANASIINTAATAATLTIASTNAAANDAFAGVISGNTSLIKSGVSGSVQTLSGVNTYTGTTAVNGGTLQAGVANALPTATALSLANTAGATLSLNNFDTAIGSLAGGGATGGNVTLGIAVLTTGDATSTDYAGAISGTGGLTKVGAGTQTLSGANTYTGTTTIKAGTIKVTSPTYTNLLTTTGGADLQGGRLLLDYGNGNPSPVAQIKTLLDNEYAANGGNFTAGQVRSTTAAANGKTLGYGDDALGTVTILYTLSGDADLNGQVNFNDFLVLQNFFSQAGTRFDQGNFNYDGQTDFNDFLALQNNFGQSVTGSPVNVTAAQVAALTAFANSPASLVPEPALLSVIGFGAAAALRRHRSH